MAIQLINAGDINRLKKLLVEKYLDLERNQFEHLLSLLLKPDEFPEIWLASLMQDFYRNKMGRCCLGLYQPVPLTKARGVASYVTLAESRSWPVSPLHLTGFFAVENTPVYSQYSYPQYHALLEDALLISGLDAIIDERNNELISEEISNHFQEIEKERFYSGNLGFIGERILCHSWPQDEVVVENAIGLFGSCNQNYAHWLFEKLPSLYWLGKLDLPADLLVLVEANLPVNIIASLEAVWPRERILKIEPGRRIRVKNLHFISNTLEFFEPCDGYIYTGKEFRIYPPAFVWLAERLKRIASTTNQGDRNLYLPRRPCVQRSIVNQDVLQVALQEKGVVPFEPGNASLAEQAAVFGRARLVVGASGAAFANLLLMPAGATAVIVCHDTPQMPMWFFHAVAQALGIRLCFFAAQGVESTHPQELHRAVMINVADLTTYLQPLLPPETTGDEIAFLVPHEELLNHFIPVWQALAGYEYSVVLAGEEAEIERIEARLDALGVKHRHVDEVEASQQKLPILVSNQPQDPSGSEPLIKRLAHRNVRFMYAAGKGGWNFAPWNELYDLILVMGPAQHQALSHFRNPVILPMGWPRMDAYFNQTWDRAALQARFHCDPQRKTIVWLPTWTEVSSVALYADTLAKLTRDYNVVVKLHPMHGEQAPEDFARLQAAGFNCLLTGSEDNVPLLQLADWVFADYGGSPFAAMYAGKPLLLLDVPHAATHFTMGVDSPDLLLRESLLHIAPDEQDQIIDLLLDSTLWQTQITLAAEVLAQHIYPFRGCAATLAASYLSNCNTVLR